jgi:hypothetical protein
LSQHSPGRPGQLVRPTELGRLLSLMVLKVLHVTRQGTFMLPIHSITQSVRLLLLQGLSQQSLGRPGMRAQATELGRLLSFIVLLVLLVTRLGTFGLPIHKIKQSVKFLLLRRMSRQSLGWPGQLGRLTELGRLLGFGVLGLLYVTQQGLFMLPIHKIIQSVRLRSSLKS